MKKDDKRTLIVVLVVCIICGIIIFFASRKSNIDRMAPVKDYSTFFSITSETEKYISYIAMDDYDNIKSLLDSSFIDSNNNGMEFGNYSPLSSLSTDSIDYIGIKDNYLYLVKGKIVENGFDSSNVIEDNFMVIVLNDTSSKSFSIYPVNNDNYEKVINSIKKINIDRNSINEIISTGDFTDVQICKLYFSDYVSKLINNMKDAYEFLGDDMKEKFKSYEEFNAYIKNNIKKISTSSKLCKMEEYDDSRVYSVIDSNDNSYTFTEKGVMNYKVYFNFKLDKE